MPLASYNILLFDGVMTESLDPVFTEYGVEARDLMIALQVSREAVRKWQRGLQPMSPANARVISVRFGIPLWRLRPDVWDRPGDPPDPDPGKVSGLLSSAP
jgi:hypothetical protein